ncbi:exodeoxyribonuclease V subunit beta [Ideonella sp. B7]|uniref:exodeoxyribonuclease V subunit beta n=1 Tax=Ideonella benzenivorans TaxID=2831643 RepID=UPI001CEC4147|nr:exodeoxyribonuclease V subunit beta [Ideonella benzenivorans]MCA6216317.1 exodeoxyribonuclease V subunit beta [Ideonella benzenivorans]
MSHPLHPLRFPLAGSQLIEASAGTGKTWTIAALYLRLVLGHGDALAFSGGPLRPDQILVMTFTRAATRELSDRIRARLLEAAQAFRAPEDQTVSDPLLAELLAAYPDAGERQRAAWRLALAAEGMDDAAIHTIDAWCQRMLREHAFDSGQLFEEELAPDEAQLLTQAVHDHWRRQVYPLTGEALDTALALWPRVEALEADVAPLLDLPRPADAGQGTLGEVLARATQGRAEALARLRVGWTEQAAGLRDWLLTQLADHKADWDGRKLKAANVTGWLDTLAAWAQGDSAVGELPDLKAGWNRLSQAGLREARKPGAPEPAWPPSLAALEALAASLTTLPSVTEAPRLHAAARIADRLALLKRQAAQFGFADLQRRLLQALQGPRGEALRQRIIGQTPVALVDEFQDTSALQYALFDGLYRVSANNPATALLLIGDPKQSIYRFRGADIGSYLQAREATEGRHHMLGTNYRSTQALVAAVNHCFAQAEARPGAGAFDYRDPQTGHNPVPFETVAAQGRPERFVHAGQAVPALTWVHDLQPASADGHLRPFAERCAEQIVQWLNEPATGFERAGQPLQRLRPADIAVLVRSGREARAVRQALRRRQVASVYLSDRESVLASDEAADLLRWLRAVAQPQDTRLVRAALATTTVGLSLDTLARLADDDEAFDAYAEQMRALQAIWQGQGVLPLLRQTVHRLQLAARWLSQPEGERRLTNVLHLAELLQTQSAQLEGEQALIRWLAEAIDDAQQGRGSGGDEQIVRLESDADLVQVITVHKSKGLEYPVVCLPFAASVRQADKKSTPFVLREATPGGGLQLKLAPDEEDLLWAERERLREDLRLFYVALTRARHALWLGLPALTIGNSKECKTHRSAAGWLVAGPEARTPEALGAALQAMAEGCPSMALQAAAADIPVTPLAPREPPPALVEAPVYDATFDRRWGIGSFSALVRDLGGLDGTGGLAATHAWRPADDEVTATPEGAARPPEATAAPWHRFERGALAGNFLHDQLEWLAGEGFAQAEAPGVAEALRRRIERSGRAEAAPDVLQWLQTLCRTPLPGLEAPLAALTELLPEMEFWLPAECLPVAELDALCRAHLLPGRDRPALTARELHGMLMGFADLVFAHDGRYWVLDYKSNQLGPDGAAYSGRALEDAMLQHRYDVQAALYLLALHRLLRARLGDAYQPETQLGGALYLFLRGIDGPTRGALHLPPPMALLDALDRWLGQGEETSC